MAGEETGVGADKLIDLVSWMRGHVTCFEGVDGAGKTSAATWLRSLILDHGVDSSDIVMIREPGGTPVGEEIRNLLLHGGSLRNRPIRPMTETLLFFAARAELYDEVVLPALASRKIVITDRCLYSTIAYQCYGLAPSRDYVFSMEHVLAIAELVLPKISRHESGLCSQPMFTVVLDIDAETRKARKNRDLDTIESRGTDFFERVRAGYAAVAQLPHVAMVDARGDLSDVQSRIVECLRQFYVPAF